ncbi:DUF3427 domain-containing protein [Staphylococcus debuckii]|uniref:DUF3427 domain-containing protein n=1 Tax=Staphylococcus debuckii TaxID=2044912 RepID=UPI000F433E3D|nr:DEAD/DEAH box helicase [Staphylococcus debuckii]AYU54410.1 DUF3427 domain-containing protein [Staphylococcus debuckii]
MENAIDDLKYSLHKGFIDRSIVHQGHHVPKLLINNAEENVLSTVIDELQKCQSFMISVAFITESGLASLKAHLYDLAQKGVKGKILTSNYLGFNTPKMYEELLKLENVEVRLTEVPGFHAKGYIFEHDQFSSLIVGSSNLTSNALKVNYEHNILFSTHQNGDLVHRVKHQFTDLWNQSTPLTPEWIAYYREVYQPQAVQRVFEDSQRQTEMINRVDEAAQIEPNLMQVEALQSLSSVRARGEDRALIISATGTGKTIMSALDVRQAEPERFLFVVHSETILNDAMRAYQKVLTTEPASAFGKLSGQHKDMDAKYLFATVQTLSKEQIHTQFDPAAFDYIVFDEAHRSAADTYQRIFHYFKPQFMLGMTATPERTDDLNIFEQFNYNVAYEIRLQKALESEILCPFHYFGVSDYVQDGMVVDDNSQLRYLTSDERVKYILDRTHYYGYSGDVLKGLIFVSRKHEAVELAEKLTQQGITTTALTGSDSQQRRNTVIQQLKDGEINYIITVDLFNEGIDIPEINQVVMLRGTQSSIIFVQQLGRGLRKSANKDYVTVIDFIGNYKNNYLIPIALSGDHSHNKDNYRKFLTDNAPLRGVSTINFEEVAKKKVFESIQSATLNEMKMIVEAYQNVKNRIGRTPTLMDFIEQNSLDPDVLLSKFANYEIFLEKKAQVTPRISESASKNLTFMSKELAQGLKSSDYMTIEVLSEQDESFESLVKKLQARDSEISEADVQTSLRILDQSFFKKGTDKHYGPPIINIKHHGKKIQLSEHFKKNMQNKAFRAHLDDLMQLAHYKHINHYHNSNSLQLYQKYSRKDFVRIMNWQNDESATVYGYKQKYQTLPVFITYHKKEDISETTAYEDEFLNQDELKWFTRSNRSLKSPEVQNVIHHQELETPMYMFVKKEDADGKNFYYLGTARYIEGTAEDAQMPDGKNVVTMHLAMDTPVRDDVYRYLVEK